MRVKVCVIALILCVAHFPCVMEAYSQPCCHPCYYNWEGPYIGINGEGYSWGNIHYHFLPGGSGSNGSNLFSPDATGGSFRQHPHGAILGAQFGYNSQWRCLVIGLEGSFNGSWVEKTTVDEFVPVTPSTVTYKASLQWFSTLTPRLGYVRNCWLYYIKGGLATGRFRVKLNSNADVMGSTHTFSQRQDHTGWTVGAGIERGWRCWILGIEYDHYRFPRGNYGGIVSPSTPFALAFTMQPSSLNTVVARLSYRL